MTFDLFLNKMAETIFANFYILHCNFVKYGPILDFIGFPESRDPEDFKSGPKKAIKGHTKVVWPAEVFHFLYLYVIN